MYSGFNLLLWEPNGKTYCLTDQKKKVFAATPGEQKNKFIS